MRTLNHISPFPISAMTVHRNNFLIQEKVHLFWKGELKYLIQDTSVHYYTTPPTTIPLLPLLYHSSHYYTTPPTIIPLLPLLYITPTTIPTTTPLPLLFHSSHYYFTTIPHPLLFHSSHYYFTPPTTVPLLPLLCQCCLISWLLYFILETLSPIHINLWHMQ